MTKQIHYTAKINAPRRTPENAVNILMADHIYKVKQREKQQILRRINVDKAVDKIMRDIGLEG